MKECNHDHCCATPHTCTHTENQQEACCNVKEEMFRLAKCAKHELLKEKMKSHFEAKIGKKLNKIAEVTVEAMLARMQHKKAKKQACLKYDEDLKAAFNS